MSLFLLVLAGLLFGRAWQGWKCVHWRKHCFWNPQTKRIETLEAQIQILPTMVKPAVAGATSRTTLTSSTARGRKFRVGRHLRWILALILLIYAYALYTASQITTSSSSTYSVFGNHDDAPNDSPNKNNNKIGVHHIVNNNKNNKVSAHVFPSQGKHKLQDKLDRIYVETGRPFDGDLWDLSDFVPQWMKGKLKFYSSLLVTSLRVSQLFFGTSFPSFLSPLQNTIQ